MDDGYSPINMAILLAFVALSAVLMDSERRSSTSMRQSWKKKRKKGMQRQRSFYGRQAIRRGLLQPYY